LGGEKVKNKGKNITLLLFLLLTVHSIVTIEHAAAQSTAIFLELPPDSTPLGLAFDANKDIVYCAGFRYGELYAINASSKQILEVYTVSTDYQAYAVAIDNLGMVWITTRSSRLIFWNSTSKQATRISLVRGSTYGITFYNGCIWVANFHSLLQINPINFSRKEYWFGKGYGIIMLHGDGNYLWLSDIKRGCIYKFNILTEEIEKVYSGFSRPLGLDVDSNYVYVAENRRLTLEEQYEGLTPNGTIALINKATDQISRVETAPITNEGPYYVLKDIYGNLWYTDNSGHYGVAGSTYYNSPGIYCYFITEVSGSYEIWFSVSGSAYLGIIEPEPSWELIFHDEKHNTTLKVDLDEGYYRFIASTKDFGVRKADYYYWNERWQLLYMIEDANELFFTAIAKTDKFALAFLIDKIEYKVYILAVKL